MSHIYVEGDDQGDLEEELYAFDSDNPEMEFSPELGPNLNVSKREDLYNLISQFPLVFSGRLRWHSMRSMWEMPHQSTRSLTGSLLIKGGCEG